MKPALCKICCTIHALREPHVWKINTPHGAVEISEPTAEDIAAASFDRKGRHVTETCAGCVSRDKRIAELQTLLDGKRLADAERQRKRRAK